MHDYVKEAALVRPSKRQLEWQRMEFNAFIHFSVNTFTDREWGDGQEDPSIFSPDEFDAGQWVEVCKSAGINGLILTCKHHDGFCLWPSKYTDHSVKSSRWRNGESDVVREVSDACRRGGLKFGIYLSPWDWHERTYGDSEEYNEYFRNQLRELLTGYGELFCVWLDGACGEGPDGKKQVYDWDSYYSVIRDLQPNAVISICGPDVRWCGNEAGHCRESEWSVVPQYLQDAEKVADKSQKEDDGEFSKKINSSDQDIGSRNVIRDAGKLVWYPAEVNTSIRPGWFYHSKEDDQVKPVEELLNVYYKSVGGNAVFLLNLPPDRRGLIYEKDAACIKKLGQVMRDTFAQNLSENASVRSSCSRDKYHEAKNVLSLDSGSYWCPREGIEEAYLEFDLMEEKFFNRVVLMENIESSGQRVEEFVLEALDEHVWKEFYRGSVIGYKHICCFNDISTRYIRLKITQSRWYPTLEFFGVFYQRPLSL